jgi:hypothetical protein
MSRNLYHPAWLPAVRGVQDLGDRRTSSAIASRTMNRHAGDPDESLPLGTVLSPPPRQHPAYLAAASLARRLGPLVTEIFTLTALKLLGAY